LDPEISLDVAIRDRAAATTAPPLRRDTEELNYYEILQISPHAEAETIHRVYRIMAGRFHPDNPETGDTDKFLLLKAAYETLSDPVHRQQYDARHKNQSSEPMPIFELKDFVVGVQAEANRRLGVLSLLYNQRRTDGDHPGVSLLDLERRMGFPREYLNFTMWYVRSKGFVMAADNSDYALTATGADFVEDNIGKSDLLGKLLFPGVDEPAP
jgi:curved DNA-binding protein CbpA